MTPKTLVETLLLAASTVSASVEIRARRLLEHEVTRDPSSGTFLVHLSEEAPSSAPVSIEVEGDGGGIPVALLAGSVVFDDETGALYFARASAEGGDEEIWEVRLAENRLGYDPATNALVREPPDVEVHRGGLAAVGLSALDVRSINLPTRDLVYDPGTGRLYASVPGRAGASGNSIVPIDPATGTLGTPIFVGSDPGALALSDDGSVMYVAIDGDYAVRAFDMATQRPGLQFSLGVDPFFGPLVAEDIEVQPGNPDVIAVARENRTSSTVHLGVAVYENGVMRSNTTQRHTGANRIEFSSDPSVLYGFHDESSDYGFWKIRVDASGAVETQVARNFIIGSVDIEFALGNVYSTAGIVLAPELPSVIGTYPELSFGTGIRVDPANGRTYALRSDLMRNRTEILVYDLHAFTAIDRIEFPGVSGTAGSFVLLGPGKVAFRTSGDQVFLVDLGGSGEPTMSSPTPGAKLYSSSVKFRWDPDGANVEQWSLLVGASPGGNEYFAGGSPGTATSTTVAGLPTDGRQLHVRLEFRVGGTWLFSDFEYEAASRVKEGIGVRRLTLPANDLAYDPASGTIYASVPGRAGAWGNSIVPIDPTSGTVGTPVWVGSEPGRLALSDDAEELYIALDGAYAVRRFDPGTRMPGLQFHLGNPSPFQGPLGVEDMEIEPGNPNVLAVSRRARSGFPRHAGVAVYDDGVMRPNTTSGPAFSNRIEFSSDPSVLYGYNNETTEHGFRTLIVDADGVVEDSVDFDLIEAVDIEFVSGLVYATSGSVVDPELKSVVGNYPEALHSTALQVDTTNELAYFLRGNEILIFDLHRFVLLDRLTVPGVSGETRSLVQYGPGLLAFLTSGDQLFLVDLFEALLPAMIEPAPGSQFTSSTVDFEWDANGNPVEEWWIYIGSSPGRSDIANSGSLGTSTAATGFGLPTDGGTLYLRLWSRIGTTWIYSDYVYTAALVTDPGIIAPAPGSTLTSATETFQWDANGTPVTDFWLFVGSSEGGAQYFNSGSLGTNLEVTVRNLPTDGRQLQVRLWYFTQDEWFFRDYPYTAATVSALPPEVSSPVPGSTLTAASETFRWKDNGTAVLEWWLYAGSKPGAKDYFDSGSLGMSTQATVTRLPTDGSLVRVRLFYRVAGGWLFRDFVYTAADIVPVMPALTEPSPGGTLSASTVTFRWTANGSPVTEWWFYAGSTAGAKNYFDSGTLGTSTETTVTRLPTDGSRIHVRLFYRLAGAWQFTDYQYTAADIAPVMPAITEPSPGATLSASTVTFRWMSNGTPVTEWWLYAGSTPGAKNYFDSGTLGTSTETTVTRLPTDGSQIHVRLFYLVAGAWQFRDYQYTAADIAPVTPSLTEPSPGSTLSASTVTFRWTANGTPVTEWWLYAGRTAGGNQYFDSGTVGTKQEATASGLPVDGTTVHVRLWFKVAGIWQFVDYHYTAALLQPALVSPAPGSTLSGSSVSLVWSANGVAVTEWWLYAGSAAGANNYFDSGSLGTGLQVNAMGLPTDGSTIHVRLWSRVSGLWTSADYAFTAASP